MYLVSKEMCVLLFDFLGNLKLLVNYLLALEKISALTVIFVATNKLLFYALLLLQYK